VNAFRGRRILALVAMSVLFVALGTLLAGGLAARPDERSEVMQVREAVWRAWFANDRKALEKLIPADTIVISSGNPHWKNQAEVFETAAKFQADGGKLTRLEFPRTEMQIYGDAAIIYSQYIVETEMGGKRSLESGRVTEIFVRRNGQWMNSGWRTDTEK
jgi:hypothetical protein